VEERRVEGRGRLEEEEGRNVRWICFAWYGTSGDEVKWVETISCLQKEQERTSTKGVGMKTVGLEPDRPRLSR
jgi:hypothetical protein